VSSAKTNHAFREFKRVESLKRSLEKAIASLAKAVVDVPENEFPEYQRRTQEWLDQRDRK
jgi:hypothetical protein